MRAMVLEKIGEPLKLREVPRPLPGPFEVLIKVHTCGVCRTDLHIMDGELPHPALPLILGHQVVGVVEAAGSEVSRYRPGERIGVPWLAGCCESCEYCSFGRENLCDNSIYTGYLRNGGYADYCTAHQDFIFPIPSRYSDLEAAPLLCAGLIGYRAFRLVGGISAKRMGFYGFGSSAHLLIQAAVAQGVDIYVFTRPGDIDTQSFAMNLGARWAGGSDVLPPEPLDAAIIFAPIGALCVEALKSVKKGGKVISAGIHMSDIPSFPYALLWGERSLSSVANLTRQDGLEWMELVQKIPIRAAVTSFPLEQANEALLAIKHGRLEGSAVLQVS